MKSRAWLQGTNGAGDGSVPRASVRTSGADDDLHPARLGRHLLKGDGATGLDAHTLPRRACRDQDTSGEVPGLQSVATAMRTP